MDHGPNGRFSIQLNYYIFLAQNYIKLQSDLFRIRFLNYLSQILKPFLLPLLPLHYGSRSEFPRRESLIRFCAMDSGPFSSVSESHTHTAKGASSVQKLPSLDRSKSENRICTMALNYTRMELACRPQITLAAEFQPPRNILFPWRFLIMAKEI